MAKVRILLADDHALVRAGLRKILEEREDWAVVAEAADGREAVRAAVQHRPNVCVMDIGMPVLNGIEATSQIVRRSPDTRVLILSMHQNEAYVTHALHSGASGYLLKDSADVELIAGVASVAAGKSFFSPAVARIMLDDYVRQRSASGVADKYDALSEREREVLQLVAEAHSSKAIAEILSVSVTTVETHRSRIFQKLDIHSTAELVLYAVRRGLVS